MPQTPDTPDTRLRSTFVVDAQQVDVPKWIGNLASFRHWARSDEFPETGRICYLSGETWIDLSKEQVFSHNQAKGEFNRVLANLAKVELEGTPDLVLEIVSTGSVVKDTRTLRELYWKAGIAEYWLVDARGERPAFDILRHTAKGYVVTRKAAGWYRRGRRVVFGPCEFHSDTRGPKTDSRPLAGSGWIRLSMAKGRGRGAAALGPPECSRWNA